MNNFNNHCANNSSILNPNSYKDNFSRMRIVTLSFVILAILFGFSDFALAEAKVSVLDKFATGALDPLKNIIKDHWTTGVALASVGSFVANGGDLRQRAITTLIGGGVSMAVLGGAASYL